MLVGTHQRTAEADELVIEISNTRLERVNKFKYLGVLLDNTLSSKDHVEYIGNKISSRLGILRSASSAQGSSQTNFANALQYFSPTIVRLLFAYLGQLWDWEQSLSR